MKTVEITLRITYDDKTLNHPRRWRWNELAEMGMGRDKGENIEVLPEPRQDDEIPQENDKSTSQEEVTM